MEFYHTICDECYFGQIEATEPHPSIERNPYRTPNPQEEVCCFCGKTHSSGLTVDCEPQSCLCKGKHRLNYHGHDINTIAA